MIIQNIKLSNIRSYTDASIDFPESSVLLSGDIGSGKSSILHALEFALFGLSKGEISGEGLLRKGAAKGAVEVKLKVGEKDYIIKRGLKKSAGKVVQDSGYVISDGLKKEGTAVELKSQILNLLGYPKELLKKKSLIYRYTVYTPQEDMKRILLDEKDYRLDTLRKIFGIDKYKRVRENAAIFMRALREKKSMHMGSIADLENIKQQLLENSARSKELDKKIAEIKPMLEKSISDCSSQKKKVEELQQKAEEKKRFAHELEICSARLDEILKKRAGNKKELEMIELRTKELANELSKINPEKPETTPEELNDEIKKQEEAILDMSLNLQKVELKIAQLTDEIKQISKLSKCPTCKQEVSADYKGRLEVSHNSEINDMQKKIEELKAEKSKKKSEVDAMKTDSFNLHKKQSQYLVLLKDKEKTKRLLDEIELRKKQLEKMQSDIKTEIGVLNMKKVEISEKMKNVEDVDIAPEKKKMDELQHACESLKIEDATLKREHTLVENVIKKLHDDIKQKEDIILKIKKIDEYYNWIEAFFVPLMSTMEKHVMGQVHREFNSLFQEWFNVLLDDESLNVRLDEDFTPIIEQNG
ncbi:SMC family ATPase, partial [Candidatus Woesearchaeota archaeon]|nr:SMC family ATPase [Candidatus Woesearchaeota archaeon]